MAGSPDVDIDRIVSGGQTGVDRAALDWAILEGVPHGGWCPAGRRAIDGPIDARYRLVETPGDDYETRTEWNVRDSDATLICARELPLTGGTALTREYAARYGRPVLVAIEGEVAAPALLAFVREHDVRTLNVAGPRETGAPGLGAFVQDVLDGLLVQ